MAFLVYFLFLRGYYFIYVILFSAIPTEIWALKDFKRIKDYYNIIRIANPINSINKAVRRYNLNE